MRVVFWQNIASPHQSPLIRSLSQREGFRVTWTVEQRQTRSYWSVPDTGQATLIVEPSRQAVLDLVTEDESDSLHIFSMHHHPRGLPLIHTAFKKCLRTQARMALMGEGTAWMGPRAVPRMALDVYYRLRWPQRIGFILCQGLRAESWFRRCGYPVERMFPFGFFVESSEDEPVSQASQDDAYVMVFIGACIHRKGLDLLLKVLESLKDFPWRLLVIGDGDKRPALESMCGASGMTDRVTFLGSLPSEAARSMLAVADLLVLPTRNDTWGAVVNEALMAGVPVLCSDMCGAKVLLNDPERGAVFRTDSHEDLQSALIQRFGMGKNSKETARRIKEWSRRIGGEAVADYVVRVMNWAYSDGPRPTPPWTDESSKVPE